MPILHPEMYLPKVKDIPRSPCVHSAAWIKCDGVPVEASEADIRWAIIPDFPVVRINMI